MCVFGVVGVCVCVCGCVCVGVCVNVPRHINQYFVH